jgi:NAD-dependent dihydropyrimidine dehydrogenase PreA subunit
MIGFLDREVIAPEAESVGLVFPIYMMTMPIPVQTFVQKLDVRAAEYVFAVAIRGGTPTVASAHLDQALKKQGKRLDAYFTVTTTWNSPMGLMPSRSPLLPAWPVPEAKIEQMQSRVESLMGPLADAIASRESRRAPPLRAAWQRALAGILPSSTSMDTSIPFCADDTCTGCGHCERVCPSGRVKLAGEVSGGASGGASDGESAAKPTWQPDVRCYACYACFNYCPTQSILVGTKFVEKTGRYHYPGISADDIAEQKEYLY